MFNPSPGADIIPRLHDAKLNGMAQLSLNINRVEEIDGALYAQSVVPCGGRLWELSFRRPGWPS